MVYEIKGIPVCGIQLGLFGKEQTYNNTMLHHGPFISNDSTLNPMPWLSVPFPLKVYAISLSTDAIDDNDDRVKCTFSVRKPKTTGSSYLSTGSGESNGDPVIFNDIYYKHHVYKKFVTEPSFDANQLIGLSMTTDEYMAVEFTVKLWCYQI